MATPFWFDPYRQKSRIKNLLRPSWAILTRVPHRLRLFAVRIAVRLLPFISIDRVRLYPPRLICGSTREWVSKAGRQFEATIRDVDPASTVRHLLPKTIHKDVRRQFLMDQTYAYPETFVATIPNGYATSRGFAITPDGQFLNDVSMYFVAPRETVATALAQDWRLEPLSEIDGRVALLATEGADLYYHWLFQLLPRYELIRRAGIELKDIDYFYVNGQRSRFQRETLASLGVEPSKIIVGEKVPYLRSRELIIPSVPLAGGCFPPWMTDFLRSSFLPKSWRDTPPKRRYYISRGRAGYRRVLNEDDVVKFLKGHRFEVLAMETLSVQEQAAAMASCEVLVAPHGGGLSNIVFCSPGTKIIEIYSPELVATYFWKLSSQLNLDYYYLLGKGRPLVHDADYPQSWNAQADIEVDLHMLERTLALANI
jgi:capsular polysaccharide biosynthesis protein